MRRLRPALCRLVAAALLMGMAATGAQAAPTPQAAPKPAPSSLPAPYCRFGVLPLQSPTMLAGMFMPLAATLGRALHRPVQFVTAPSFSAFMRRVRRREYDVIYLNPLLYARAQRFGYHVIVKVAGEPFTGIVVVRRDSPLRDLAAGDLPKGLSIGFPDPNAYAATVMVRQYMATLGDPVDRNFKVRYFASQDSALMAVYYGLVDMAGTWGPSLRSMPPKVRNALRVIAQTPPQPQMPIAVRDDMPPREVARLRDLLTHLTESPDGRSALRHLGFRQGFVAATEAEYQGIKP